MKRTGILAVSVALMLLTGCGRDTSTDVDSTVATTANSSTAITTSAITRIEEATVTTTVGKVDFTTTSSEATTITITTPTTNKVATTSTTKTATTTMAVTTTISTAKTTTNPATTTIATTTTALDTRSTVMWADMNTPIYCSYDDPWEYPYDLKTCLRDCKAYIEENGLTWDDSLTLDNSTWAGNISSVPYAAWGGEPTFKSDVFSRIDIEIQSWPTDRHYKVLFVPLNNPPFEGCYEVFVIHS